MITEKLKLYKKLRGNLNMKENSSEKSMRIRKKKARILTGSGLREQTDCKLAVNSYLRLSMETCI